MPVPRELGGISDKGFKKKFFLTMLLGVLLGVAMTASVPRAARATGEDEPLQTSGDKSFWDRKHHRVELVGHAIVRQAGETLMADDIVMDFGTRMLNAKGNCIYVTLDSVVYGDEMHINMDSRTGTVIGARITSAKFSLSGERINKLSDNRYQAHWGEYSTCRDCPNSWSLEAEDVDMTLGQYAYMSNVTAKIKDAPTFWLPYMVVPVKTQRQTGFLFPKFGFATNMGFTFVLPFFWATSRSTDMTIGLGDYSARGRRVEWEGRYALSPRSTGQANFYDISDSQAPQINGTTRRERWGFNMLQTQELPYGIDEKLKVTEVADTYYPIDFGNDIANNGNMVLTDDLIFNYATPDISAYVDTKRIRNLINVNTYTDPNQQLTAFDPSTVQLYPAGAAMMNDKFLFGTPVAAGLSMGVSNFTRTAGPFDYDVLRSSQPSFVPGSAFIPGVDPIREATRFSFTPSLYTTLRPFDVVDFVPSVTYYGYYYSFHNAASNLSRGYLLLQADLSTQLEKIWDTPDPDQPKQKNLIRPLLTYSNIPYIAEDREHPFLEQIQYAQTNGITGYNFDDYDIVPVDNSPSQTNYFVPEGNSLAAGFTTQLITREGAMDDPSPTYVKNVEWTGGEAINFRQFQNAPDNREPLTRAFSTLDLNLGKFTSSTTYYYYPYIGQYANVVSTGETYIFERATHQQVLTYDRSFTLGFTRDQHTCTTTGCGTIDLNGTLNFSLNDYILPTSYVDYSFVAHQFNDFGFGLAFQSPSRCWELTSGYGYTIQTKTSSFGVNLALNLSGSGFGFGQ